MLDSAIGPVSFVSLSRIDAPSSPPPSPHEMVIPVQRIGVPGTAFILGAAKGAVFQMRGFAVFSTRTDAEASEVTYRDMIGVEPYTITWGGSVVAPHQYVVLDVMVLRVQRCGASSSGHGAFSESIWTLCAVEV